MDEISPFFYGRAENKLNSKGQVAIPARFRSTLPEEDLTRNFVIIRGESDCLYMYTHRQFARIKDNVRILARDDDDCDFFRNFMAEAYAVDLDTQGRFVLPQSLMKSVGIPGPGILFVGVDDRIEIWDPARYSGAVTETGDYEALRRSRARMIFDT